MSWEDELCIWARKSHCQAQHGVVLVASIKGYWWKGLAYVFSSIFNYGTSLSNVTQKSQLFRKQILDGCLGLE